MFRVLYVTVTSSDDDPDTISIESERYPVDLISWNPTMDPQSSGAPVVTRVRTRGYTGISRRRVYIEQSPRQDATSTPGVGQGPKTRGGTNEFISAFWVKGKPKCRKGYRYDFSRKMCRLIK